MVQLGMVLAWATFAVTGYNLFGARDMGIEPRSPWWVCL